MKRERVIFVGAGHAHLYSLIRIEAFARRNIHVDVISPGPFRYSGMGPGLLSGQYGPQDNSVDVKAIVDSRGGRFIEDRVTAINAETRSVTTSGGETIQYDAMSLNIGSEVAPLAVDDGQIPVLTVKPVQNFLKMRDHLLAFRPGSTVRILVAGGGPAGCEASANALSFCRRNGYRSKISLFTGSSGLLSALSEKAGRIMADWFMKNGITVETGRRIIGSGGKTVLFDDGSREEADMVILATGVHPPSLSGNSGLAVDKDGALVVDDHLESVSHKGVFGGGDCIALRSGPLGRVGVYAVRQGPILFNNLLASVTGGEPRMFRPQKKYLLILNLGDGTGLLSREKFTVAGRVPLFIKNWIDRRFIRKYKPL